MRVEDDDDKIDHFELKHSVLNWWENLVYPTLKLHEQMCTQPFYVKKIILPNSFLFGTNPSINNEQSRTLNNLLPPSCIKVHHQSLRNTLKPSNI